jgi:hypothetical protein
MIRNGVCRFDLIGGEVSSHGNGWLSLVRRIRDLGADTVCLISNGWFLFGKHASVALYATVCS